LKIEKYKFKTTEHIILKKYGNRNTNEKFTYEQIRSEI